MMMVMVMEMAKQWYMELMGPDVALIKTSRWV